MAVANTVPMKAATNLLRQEDIAWHMVVANDVNMKDVPNML